MLRESVRLAIMNPLFANRKSSRYVRGMSSIGFAPLPEASEIERLRSIYRTLQRLQTNLVNMEGCLKRGELKRAGNHLAIARANVKEAKKELAGVGQSKSDK